ncbi:MAG TPA: Gfo/Idh/MocA family oxidoreductase [Burkholderiales bacterium]|nr:Gfo/Idh/MocA family oxidoreductase [Burkholderiales bacterium]
MSRKVRWGILGCAGIAERSFIPAVKASSNGLLYGIAARDPQRAAEWARTHGFERSSPDYQTLVSDPAIDAVYIPLPNHLHAEWSVRAARAGKHVLCEKPMAMNGAEVRLMTAVAEASGVLLMEGFMYKFHPQMERTMDLIAGGAIGPVRSAHSSFTFMYEPDGRNYRWFPEMGGGALYDVGCYTVSAARLVFGVEPVSAVARAVLHPKYGVDVSTHVLLEFPGGRFAHCDCAFDAHFQSRLLVVGEQGTLSLDRAFSAKHHEVEVRIVRGDAVERVGIPSANMFTRMVEHFGAAALEGRPLRVPVRDAEMNMRTIDACFESIRTGGAVGLAPS